MVITITGMSPINAEQNGGRPPRGQTASHILALFFLVIKKTGIIQQPSHLTPGSKEYTPQHRTPCRLRRQQTPVVSKGCPFSSQCAGPNQTLVRGRNSVARRSFVRGCAYRNKTHSLLTAMSSSSAISVVEKLKYISGPSDRLEDVDVAMAAPSLSSTSPSGDLWRRPRFCSSFFR